ncbi:hypothetical protein D770_21330 [Flammeovirgaceae bacterium 311]|nr:hypothetical protein D770_21330 [Flammeovirgaceae bacterium 311]
MILDLLILNVQYRNLLFLSLLLLGLPLGLQAQILDDSTKLVYGPTTTSFIREANLYYQLDQEYHPDTLIRNFYRILPPEQSGYRTQTLDNLGTAQNSIFYTFPDEIGARSGFYVYDYWFNEPSEIRYYNTRSPYTGLFFSQGGNGRSWVDVTHSRNINPRWNAGVDFRRITAEQQIDPSPQSNQRNQIVSTAYDIFTRYQGENERYQLLASLSRLKHNVRESGGIRIAQLPEELPEMIRYETSLRRLANARTTELRVNAHLYQEYKLINALQLYHILDRETRTHTFSDLAPAARYYRKTFDASLEAISEEFESKEFTNQLGVKGAYGAGQWNAYAKHRSVRFFPTPALEYKVNEIAVGGYLALQPDTIRTLRVEAELRSEGQYRFEALAQNRWLMLRYQRSQHKPAFIYEYRNTFVDTWRNNFRDPVADRLEGTLLLKLGPVSIQPGLQLSVVQHPLYFRTDSLTSISRPLNIRPVQGAAFQSISPRLRASLVFAKVVHWDVEAIYTSVTGNSAEALQVPDWMVNSSLYFEGPLFGDKLMAQLGVDVHLKAAYYADGYDPVTRQFIVQQDFLVPTYPIANLFFGFKINHTRVFARLSHLNQGLTDRGYFLTPYYNGIQRSFDIGIDWLFFD